jgi:hypothetical protein
MNEQFNNNEPTRRHSREGNLTPSPSPKERGETSFANSFLHYIFTENVQGKVKFSK